MLPFLVADLNHFQGQEEQRESLLKSLLKQLRDYVEKVPFIFAAPLIFAALIDVGAF